MGDEAGTTTGGTYVDPGEFTRDSATSPPGSPPTGATATRSSPAATGWSSAGPARGRTGRSSCAGCSGWRTCSRWASAGPTHDERSWTFDLDPGGRRPGARHRAAAGGVLRPRSRTTTGASPCRRSSTSPTGAGRHQRLRADHPRPVDRVDASYHRAGAPDLYPEALRDEIDEVDERGLPRRQQRRLPVRLRRHRRRPTSEAYDRLFDRLDWLSRAAGRPALPGRRHDHRGRRPAVHHAGPLRRRLPRPLQVQPAEADRDAGAVGVRPRPVPDARASATPSTSSTSSGTTTWCTATSTRPGSCRSGPDLSGWLTPHGREALGGRPFGDGTPPGPPSARRGRAAGARPRSADPPSRLRAPARPAGWGALLSPHLHAKPRRPGRSPRHRRSGRSPDHRIRPLRAVAHSPSVLKS